MVIIVAGALFKGILDCGGKIEQQQQQQQNNYPCCIIYAYMDGKGWPTRLALMVPIGPIGPSGAS